MNLTPLEAGFLVLGVFAVGVLCEIASQVHKVRAILETDFLGDLKRSMMSAEIVLPAPVRKDSPKAPPKPGLPRI